MSMNLYVAKSDGDREVLNDVNVDMAREVFAEMDWDSQLAAVKAAGESGAAVFMPEFGVTDDAGRTLVISPVDAETVSFYIQYPDRLVGAQNFPKGNVAFLIGLFFEGMDDEIAGLVPQSA